MNYLTTQEIHNKLQDDLAYDYSVKNYDAYNMAIVLRAYGFKFDLASVMDQLDLAMNAITFKELIVAINNDQYEVLAGIGANWVIKNISGFEFLIKTDEVNNTIEILEKLSATSEGVK